MSIDEREWQAQEKALRDSRNGVATDPQGPSYRCIADALRAAPQPQLPADFAVVVAAKAARDVNVAVDTRLEAVMTVVMTVLLVSAGLACAFAYGRDWLAPLFAALPESPTMPLRLALTLAACAGLSWMLDGWTGRRSPDV